MPQENSTLTAVPGLAVGHAEVPGGGSGCTVILGPFRAVVEVRGLATGSRELGVLDPTHLVSRQDAILLTGGSAFGLAAAEGVMAWLAERGRGFDTGVARVPLVPAGVIFDLAPGRARPGPEEGRAACDAAHEGPVSQGARGAGAGARVGKLGGPDRAMQGGVGSAATSVADWTVGALAVVNAAGDVTDRRGEILAGARGPGGEFLDSGRLARGMAGGSGFPGEADPAVPAPGTNTTLAVVATDAPMDRIGLARMARVAATALARRISPVHTPFDGDLIFALSTSEEERAMDPGEALALGVAACDALEESIERGVRRDP
jgi:L-aminopeptidase/D-esterase-like protein